MVKPYRVLDTYKWGPKGRYASKIGSDLIAYTEGLGLIPLKNSAIQRNPSAGWYDEAAHACVRMNAEPQSEATGWHQDGDTTVSRGEMDFALVLWASRDHTQFKHAGGGTGWPPIPDQTIYQPKDYEIVIAKNLAAYHRRPPGLKGRRWQFRQRVEVPEWL